VGKTRRKYEGVGNVADPDEAWVRLVLSQHAPPVGAWLRSRYSILTAEDVEDIIVMASIRIWRNRDNFDAARGSLRTWFARIADNVARRLIETGWVKTRSLEVPLDERQDLAAPDKSSPDMAAADKSSRADPAEDTPQALRIRHALDRLPEAYRTILLADACAAGRVASAEFLSQELQLPAGTVRVYRHRAVIALQKLLAESGYEFP
jgi:RNA polymerase sigma factor (sigma-70 family)